MRSGWNRQLNIKKKGGDKDDDEALWDHDRFRTTCCPLVADDYHASSYSAKDYHRRFHSEPVGGAVGAREGPHGGKGEGARGRHHLHGCQ